MKKKIKKDKIILWIIFIITALAIVGTMFYDYINLKKLSSQTEAIITNVKDNDDYYKYTYEFKYKENKYFGEYSSNKKYEEGELLVIKYNPNEPTDNCEISKDNSKISTIVGFISVFILFGELAYLEEKTVNSKKIDFEKKIRASKNIFLIINVITLSLLVLTIFIKIHSSNYYIMDSIKMFVYVSLAFALIVLFFYLFIIKTLNKVKKDPVLLEEIKNSKEINCETTSVYLSDKHIIEIGTSLQVISYSDIVLMNLESQSDSDGPDFHYILLITKDLKKHYIASIQYKGASCHEEIMKEIRKKVPNILEGYTEENKEIINKMKNDLENKHYN